MLLFLQFLNYRGYFWNKMGYFNSKMAWYKNGTHTTSTGARSLHDNMNNFPRTLRLDLSFRMPKNTYFSSLLYPLFTLPFSLSTPTKWEKLSQNFSERAYSPYKMKRTRKMLFL